MGDTATMIIAIFLAAILMFIFPLMTMADKTDDTTKLSIQTSTTEFTNTVRTTGKLTQENYDNFVLTLSATGNSYDVEITIQKSDENPAKKTTGSTTTIGETVYYTLYTTQVLEQLADNGTINLNEGDIISVSVENTNETIGEQLRNFFYKVTGSDSSTITAEASGMVTKSATD